MKNIFKSCVFITLCAALVVFNQSHGEGKVYEIESGNLVVISTPEEPIVLEGLEELSRLLSKATEYVKTHHGDDCETKTSGMLMLNDKGRFIYTISFKNEKGKKLAFAFDIDSEALKTYRKTDPVKYKELMKDLKEGYAVSIEGTIEQQLPIEDLPAEELP